jgi:hypothetical protein
MNPSSPQSAANIPYGSIRYHYQYGRHQQYGHLPAVSRYGVRPYWSAKQVLSPPKPQPIIDDGPQTVEDLIQEGFFAVPAREPELAGLYDRRQTSWMALDDVLGQIRDRHEVYRRNILDIQWAQCYAFNELARNGPPATDEAYAAYERRMQDLRADQRAERVALWRDVARIRERLPESVQQYLSAFRKLQILGDDRGDGL